MEKAIQELQGIIASIEKKEFEMREQWSRTKKNSEAEVNCLMILGTFQIVKSIIHSRIEDLK